MPSNTINQIIKLYEKTKAPTILFDQNLTYIWANEKANEKYPFLKTHSGISSILSEEEKTKIFENIQGRRELEKRLTTKDNSDERWSYIHNVKTPFLSLLTLHFTVFQAIDESCMYLCTISTNVDTPLEKDKNNVFSLTSYYIREPLFYIFSALDSLKILYNQNMLDYNIHSINTYIDSISTNSYKILRLVTNINKYLKILNSIDVGKNDLKEIFYLNRFVDKICHAIHLTTISNDISFYYNISDNDMVVNMNVDTLSTIILHLISNSFTYTREGNKVSLSLTKEDDFAVITVTDHGTGISEKKLKDIFIPFHNADTSLSEKQGIGLGLTISKLLSINDGGELTIESKINHGTTATYKIPLSSDIQTKVITLNQIDSNLVSNKFSKIYVDLAGFSKQPSGG